MGMCGYRDRCLSGKYVQQEKRIAAAKQRQKDFEEGKHPPEVDPIQSMKNKFRNVAKFFMQRNFRRKVG